MKKTIFLILIGLFVAIPAALNAETVTVDVDQIRYTVDTDAATAEVYGLTSSSATITDLVIPDFIEYETNQYPVTSIRKSAFSYRTNLCGSLTIGQNVTTIGEDAFIHCSNLTGSLSISDNVSLIGRAAFNGCNGLNGALTLGKNVTTIGEFAFYMCSSFTGSLNIPDNVTTIGASAFYHCSGFTGTLTLGKNITTIGSGAFSWCTGLNGSLAIPENVTLIGNSAFFMCSSFTGSLTIPDNVTTIGHSAFACCDKISSLEIRSQNIEIYYDAFQMDGLEYVTSLATTPPPCIYEGSNDKVFFTSKYGIPLYVPAQSVDSYKTATEWKKFTNINPLPVSEISISLNKSETTLLVGESETLIATLEPEGATDDISWSVTADPAGCVSVENGKITAHAVGTAIVTATCGEASASCRVTVNPIPASGITLNVSDMTLLVGATDKLTAAVEPANVTAATITWASDNEAVTTVAADGTVTAVSVGVANITATCGEASASCKVTVNPIPATGITLNVSDMTLLVGATDKLTAAVEPANVTAATITWASDNEAVTTVAADGTVTAVSVGVANITATCGEASASCKVTVNPILATGITLNVSDMTLLVGATDKLTATVEPANVTDATITWTSDNEAVATVDADGTVTAVTVGVANITATCGEATATCKVTVNPILATEIVLNMKDMTLTEGESAKLTATVKPDNTTYPDITWTSANESVATVDTDGMVTAVSEGSVVITASCGEVTAICNVTVVALPAPVVRPETPSKMMRKGNGTSCTFIVMMDMTDSQLAQLGYSFVYGYTDAAGADNVIARTSARYCHTSDAVFNNAANDFWVFAVCTDGEGITAGSGRRHLDGSVDDDYDMTAILDAARGIDGTDSANWIRPTSRGARITIESADDATVTVYNVGGRLMMTQNVEAGTALSEEINSDVLAPATYIIRVVSGKEAVTKKVIIR